MRLSFTIRLLTGLSFGLLPIAGLPAAGSEHPGAAVYTKLCVDCHGKTGEGVKGEFEEPLVGERSLPSLTRKIHRTMPEDDPKSLTPEEAAQVASYIYDAFYSPAAQARLNPPKVDLARLTVPQYRTTVADLIANLRGGMEALPAGERGLKGRYSGRPVEAPKEPENEDTGEVKKREDVRFERIDRQVALSLGGESPDPATMGTEQFSVRWEGSVFAEETGTYEFVLKTENGARLYLNDMNKKFIDAWVKAGTDVREEKKSIFLLGGRAYPLLLEFFKYKDKTASIHLQWKPPHGVLETIPERFLAPRTVRPTMIVSTTFPADDRSVGYERGTGVSKAWHQAATEAAVTVAAYVDENLGELAGAKPDAPDRGDKLRDFGRRFLELAFRRPLTPEQECWIETQFDSAKSPELAVKRIALFALKSPQFLYPQLAESASPDDHDIASRLALTLWDSIPDAPLREAAGAGKLHTRAEIGEHAQRMLGDPRTKAKLRGFFHHWLELDRADGISKDPQAFPGFDERVLADLRTSLTLFVDEIVWSERSDYRELLGADYLLLNERLAKFYGKEFTGEGYQRVAFDRNERAGVVTHPYLMSMFALGKYTSPIHRGVFLARNLLGIALKSPPEAVAFEDSKFDPTFTMREKVTELTRNTSCMSCHAVINPVGFALEQLDAVGRWRTEDNKKPVNAVAELSFDDGETVRLTGARDIAEFAVKSENGQRGFVRQLFQHFAKQDTSAFGPETLNRLHHFFTSSEFHIQKLIAEIAVVAATHSVPQSDSALAQQ